MLILLNLNSYSKHAIDTPKKLLITIFHYDGLESSLKYGKSIEMNIVANNNYTRQWFQADLSEISQNLVQFDHVILYVYVMISCIS